MNTESMLTYHREENAVDIYVVESWGYEERCTQDHYQSPIDAVRRVLFLKKLIDSLALAYGKECRQWDTKIKVANEYESKYGIDLTFANGVYIKKITVY